MTRLTLSLALTVSLAACGDDGGDDTDGAGTTDATTDDGGSDGTDAGDGDGDSDDSSDPSGGSTGDDSAGSTDGTDDSGGSTGGDGTGGGGSDGGSDGGTGGGGMSFASDVYPIIAANCSCHVNGAPADLSMADAATAHGNLVGMMSSRVDKIRVVAGDSASSYVIEKLTMDPPEAGDRMPKDNPMLGQGDIDTIAAWIDSGANP